MNANHPTPLELVAEKIGSLAALARHFGITRGAVNHWKQTGVPAEHCPEIERLTGVPCEVLNPKINWSVLRQSSKEAADA